MFSLCFKFFLVGYNLAITALWKILCISRFFLPERWKSALDERRLSVVSLQGLHKKRQKKKDCILFFCSSAGEFEQVRPLLYLITRCKKILPVVVFASTSGSRYAKVCGDDINYLLAPMDLMKYWKTIAKMLQPALCIIVRHEFWPNFIYVMKKSSYLWSMNVYVHEDFRQQGYLHRWLRECLLNQMHRIWVVDKFSQQYFTWQRPNIVMVSGDTKYDSVWATQNSQSSKSEFTPFYDSRLKILVIGSGWPEDMKIILGALSHLLQEDRNLFENLRVIFFSHVIDPAMVRTLETLLRQSKISWQTCYTLGDQQSSFLDKPFSLVAVLGQLFAFYQVADMAFIGGGFYHRVHNVLEAVVWGASVAFGPHYRSSHEAKSMIKEGVAHVVYNAQGLSGWIKEQLVIEKLDRDAHRGVLEKYLGATRCLWKEIDKEFQCQQNS